MALSTVPSYDGGSAGGWGGHAVVVGASISGLLAARVLDDGFERVTVVEKDDLPDHPSDRPGVPQSPQVHDLKEAGMAVLEKLCPGYGDDLLAAGGVAIDAGRDLWLFGEGAFLADSTGHHPVYAATRPLFEYVLRRHVRDLEHVTVRSGWHLREYVYDEAAGAVEGVLVRDRNGETQRYSADLVVDATGRTSHTPNWLETVGFERPRLEEVHVDMGYSTAAVRRPSGDRRGLLVPPSSPRTRGGAVFPVEDGRWLVNLHGVDGDYPPTDPTAFRQFAVDLPTPEIHRLLTDHRLLTPEIEFYPFPSSRRYYYEDLDAFPEGLVVVGDAIASFTPVHGQGMSVAALEALVLHHCLAAGGVEGVGPRFFERASETVDNAWLMAVGSDHQFAGTTGPKPDGTERLSRCLAEATRSARTSGDVRDQLLDVTMLKEPPAMLFERFGSEITSA